MRNGAKAILHAAIHCYSKSQFVCTARWHPNLLEPWRICLKKEDRFAYYEKMLDDYLLVVLTSFFGRHVAKDFFASVYKDSHPRNMIWRRFLTRYFVLVQEDTFELRIKYLCRRDQEPKAANTMRRQKLSVNIHPRSGRLMRCRSRTSREVPCDLAVHVGYLIWDGLSLCCCRVSHALLDFDAFTSW